MSMHVSSETMVSDNDHADDDGARFVIVGHGRLALSVARKLTARAAEVVLVTRDAKAKTQVESKLADLANGHGKYGRAPQLQVVAGDGDWNVLADPELDLSGSKCLLALADQREDNLRAALVASQTADCPTVLRAFHPSIAYGIETQRHGKAREHRGPDWRPFSMAHLAAPSFVAAALLEGDDRYVETMRLGDEYVAVCRLTVRDTSRLPQRRSTRLRGRSATELLAHAGCQVMAIRHVGGGWATETDLAGHRLEPGDEVVIGGPMAKVFALVRNHSRRLECGLIGTEQVAATGDPETAAAARGARPRGGKPGLVLEALRVRIRDAWVEASTLATRVLIGLITVVTIVVIMFFPLHGVADGVYLWVITALGNPYQGAASSPHHAMVSAIGLLSGGVALGLWVSLMSAYFIERRMIETTQRRARRLRHHVVVVGLSDVGLRVAELLGKLGIRYAIVDTGDGDAARRSLELARDRPPILGGELENAMEQAGVDRAAAVIACSDDNLVNVEACLRAKRRPSAAPVRTVARIFDDVVAERAARMFGVDRSIAAVDVAAPAFVDAAVHGDGVREIGELDGLSLKALCRRVEDIAVYGQPADWDRRGVRLLAVWDGTEIKPPSGNGVPSEAKSVIIAGPAQNIDRLAGSSPR